MSHSQFTPLDISQRHIRLLILQPGQWTDVICCRLIVVSLNESLNYEALSYCWGSPETSVSILLNNHNHKVTNNLANALRRLRSESACRKLWVDALCIDQENKKEKTEQISMMRDIYTYTARCLLWLGEETNVENPDYYSLSEPSRTARTLECTGNFICQSSSSLTCPIPGNIQSQSGAIYASYLLHSLAKCSKQGHVYNLYDDHGNFLDAPWGKNQYPKWFDPACQYLDGLFVSRQWWNRVWTLEESVLPSNVIFICGGTHWPWKLVCDASDALQRCRKCCEVFLNKLNSASSVILWHFCIKCFRLSSLRNGHQSRKMWSLLIIGRIRESWDPRDKVYALFGLAEPLPYLKPLVADYRVAPRHVMEDICFEEIRSSKSLKPLIFPSDRPPNSFELSSWATDWSAKISEEKAMIVSNWAVDYEDYNACGDLATAVTMEEVGQLSTWGFFIDAIEDVGPQLVSVQGKDIREYNGIFIEWRQLLDYRRHENSPYGSRMEIHRAFMCAMLGGRLVRRTATAMGPKRRLVQITETELSFYEKMTSGNTDISDCTSEMQNDVLRGVKYRCLFVTRTGYIGFASGSIARGDEIYVLHGGHVPVVLRPLPTRFQDRFTLQGTGYVQGIMHGEGLENVSKKELKIILV